MAAFNVVLASDLVADSWNVKASMSQARWSLGVVAVDGKIYAIGGSTVNDGYNSGVVGTNERYDPVTNTWTTLVAMPTPRYGFAIAAYQGKIYCMGGTPYVEADMKPRYDIVEVYDIATDSWSTKSNMPFRAGGLHGHVVNGKIFVINGNAFFMYDPVTDEWTRKPDVPIYFFYLASVVVDDEIILTGGFIIATYPTYPTVQYAPKAVIYNVETDEWREGKTETTLSCANDNAGATTGVHAPQKIYVFSGSNNNLIYDPALDTWSTANAMPSNRSHFGVAVIDDVLYVIGGLDYDLVTALAINEQYIPIGYHDTLPPVTSPPTPSESSDVFVSSEPEPSETSRSFLTDFVGAVLVLVAGLVLVGVFLYFRRSGKIKRPVDG
ncbi:MAG: hypothetical protein FWG55_00455 [Candidatus Bathyarchaeota archaeon]|nr:hypothetical protein [Candidatus Termiticorpusculum sp.]